MNLRYINQNFHRPPTRFLQLLYTVAPAISMGALQLMLLLVLLSVGEGRVDQDNFDPSNVIVATSDPPAITRPQQKGLYAYLRMQM